MSWFPSPEDVHVYVRCSYSILCFLHPPTPPPSPTHSRIICMDFCSALSKRTRKRLEVKTKMKTNCFLRDENYIKKKHDTVDSASIASRKKKDGQKLICMDTTPTLAPVPKLAAGG